MATAVCTMTKLSGVTPPRVGTWLPPGWSFDRCRFRIGPLLHLIPPHLRKFHSGFHSSVCDGINRLLRAVLGIVKQKPRHASDPPLGDPSALLVAIEAGAFHDSTAVHVRTRTSDNHRHARWQFHIDGQWGV